MRLILLLSVAVMLLGCPRRAEAPPDAAARATAAEGSRGAVGAGAAAAAATVKDSPPPRDVPAATAEQGSPVANDAVAAQAAPPPETNLGAGEPCTQDAECGPGLVCEGCSDDDARCLPGCRKDSDCAGSERCNQVHCIRCPCPPLCGA